MDKTRIRSIIYQDLSVPDDFTFRHLLYCCYAIQQWECLKQPLDSPYRPGYFYNAIEGILHGLETTSRTTALRHHHTSTCIACDEPVDITRSRLDHIMPLAKGGKEDLSNALVLCRSCNSSKGTKDLLDWWLWKARNPLALDRRVLCLYARIHWQEAALDWLRSPCSDLQRQFLATRVKQLPTSQHHVTLYASTYAGCGLAAWLHTQSPPLQLAGE